MASGKTVSDTGWVSGMFGLMARARDEQSRSSRRYTNLHFNFADTSLGGSQAINCPPQFTLNCDPPFSGLFARPVGRNRMKLPDDSLGKTLNNLEDKRSSVGSYRMGSFFFEGFYNNQHYAHFRFGKPKYAGIIRFFANNYDSNLAHLARTGDYTSIVRTAGKWAGTAALYSVLGPTVFFPLIITAQVLKFATGSQPSKYYYLKPTMHSYLRAVQGILDTQGLHYRMFPMWEVFGRDYKDSEDKPDIEEVYAAMPDIWKSNGKFDVYKMINRYQVLQNYQTRTLEEIYEGASSDEEYYTLLEAHMRKARTESAYQNYADDMDVSLQRLEELFANNPAYHSDSFDPDSAHIAKALDDSFKAESLGDNGLSQEQIAAQVNISEEQAKTQTIDTFFESVRNYVGSMGSDISEQAASEILDGGQWISWMVSNKESITDSFSNSTREPTISSTLKGISSQARSIEVSTSGGNTGFSFVDSAMKGVKQFLAGAADSLHLTGLAGLYNSAVIDFPDVYDDSTAEVGTTTLNFPLQSWSGNDLDLYQNIIVPIAFWLAAALPNSTGKQSYADPFYLEAYSPGKFVIRNGIITSLTITRGEGNMPFRADGKMLGCTISVTIRDLSKIVHMPLIQDPGIFDDDSKYSDYMAVLGSASLFELTNGIQKINFNLNRWKQSWKSYFMTGNVTSGAMNQFPVRVLSQFLADGRSR